MKTLGRGKLPDWAKHLFRSHRYKVVYGGRGGTRSWSFARALLIEASERTLRILCTRELQRSIRGSVHQLLRDQIRLLGLPGFTVTDTEIRHTNGSLFLFLGLRYNVEEVKSLEGVDICWVEEAERVPKASWEALIPTIRKPGSEIWVTFNPDLETDDTYRRFILHPPPGTWVKRVGWRQNPWLPDELKKERDYLAKVDPESELHVWGGECRQSSAAQVLHGKWVIDDVDPQPDWDGPYHGLDFGFATDPAALVQVYVAGGTLHVQQELYRVGLDLDRMAKACQEAVPGCEEYVIRGDCARPESISYLSKPHADPSDGKLYSLPRIEPVDKWGGSVADGIAYLRQFDRIVVHSRCRHWVAEARAYSYKVDERSGDILPIIVDKDNHCLIGSTVVNTVDGSVAIERLVGRTGLVPTLRGLRRFHSVRQTAARAPIYRVGLTDGREFSCTAEHPVLTTEGWVPTLALGRGMRIVEVDASRYEDGSKWDRSTLASTDDATAATSGVDTTAPTRTGRRRCCTAMSGGSTTARSRPARTYITDSRRTSTRPTPSDWNLCRRAGTWCYTAGNSPRRSAHGAGGTLSRALCPPRRRGIAAAQEGVGTPNTPGVHSRSESIRASATSAVGDSRAGQQLCAAGFARMPASLLGAGQRVSTISSGNVPGAGLRSRRTSTATRGAVRAVAPKRYAIVESVTFVGHAPVYNMEVEDAHHFPIAGGLVVHNCVDATRYALAPMIRHRPSAFGNTKTAVKSDVRPLFAKPTA